MTQVEVPDMQAAVRQFQEQEERERSMMPQYTDEVYLTPSHTAKDKKLAVATILCIPPFLGLFGAHHFYLRRYYFGIVYACTMGLFGMGWVADWFRIGSLVRKCNKDTSEARAKGHWIHSDKYPGYLTEKSFVDAFLLWLPPFGIFGLYHFYLGRSRYGRYQACTCGFFLVGWLFDLFRLAYMVEKANTDVKLMKKGTRIGEDPYKTSDAYLLAIPLGVFGLHHFYLQNKSRAILFLCTFGVLGIGWLTDLFQMPLIVKDANKKRQMRERLQDVLTHGVQGQNTQIQLTVVASTNQGYVAGPGGVGGQPGLVPGATVNLPEPPPAYRENAAEGETVIHEGDLASSAAGPSTVQRGAEGGGYGVELPPGKQ